MSCTMHDWIVCAAGVGLTMSLVGCGDISGDDWEDASPPEACRDMADTVASKASQCGDDYSQVRNNFILNAADGDCDNVVEIRSKPELYNDCIPWWEGLTCNEYETTPASEIPASCEDQLLIR